MTNIKGLNCNVYKFPLGECTNNGLSSKHTSLLLVGDGIERGPFSPEDGEDYLVCEYRPQFKDYIATPKSLKDSGKWAMFGGNFIYSSDSRFPANAPIKIFDRVEG